MKADNIINFNKNIDRLNPPYKSIYKNVMLKKRVSNVTSRIKNVSDRIRVIRFQNNLEKMRLRNAIENYKIKNRVELLRRKGLLPMPQTRIVRPIIIQPYHNDPMINADISSAFNADMGHAEKSLFSNENFYGGERYYDEDIYGTEFNGDMLAELGINIRPGVSPLLY